jgi:hypothetical protein
MHAPKFFIIHKEKKLLTTIIQIYYPFHVDVVMLQSNKLAKTQNLSLENGNLPSLYKV